MSKYTALTIGPIYPTFDKARKTRELWGGSFLFSMLMKKIVEQIEVKENIILPYANVFPELEAVGLYPDRLLYKGELELDAIVSKAIDEMAKLICTEWVDEVWVKKFLERYLRVCHFSSDLEEMEEAKGNYVDQLNLILNSLELNDKIQQDVAFWSIESFYKYLTYTKLYREHFSKKYEKRSRSLVEIATNELSGVDGYAGLIEEYIEKSDEETEGKGIKDSEFNFLKKLKEIVDEQACKEKKEAVSFKNYHKYVAVVYADGDKMGKLIKEVVARESEGLSVHDVSNELFEWAKAASDRIDGFGGMPVYAGGDDLLFFAPIVNHKGGDLFTLLSGINKMFGDHLHHLLRGKVSADFVYPSLSFGVSIAYYKFPLNEALETAHGLLDAMKGKEGNGVCLKILKHSGSDYEYTMRFDGQDGLLEVFRGLMMSNDFDQTMLNSTVYHLQNNLKVFDELNGDCRRIRSFFVNRMETFPDEKEILGGGKHYLLEVEKLVVWAFKEKAAEDEQGRYVNRMLPVYDMLRMVKFFKGMDEIH